MKSLGFMIDVLDIDNITLGAINEMIQWLNDELEFQLCLSYSYVETFDEIREEAAGIEACKYDYAMELIQGYSADRARIMLFSSLGFIDPENCDLYLEIIDASISLCKKFLHESAIWKG